MKANSNQAVLATLARLGAGMDVVSEGELRRARAAGVPGEKIIFSGVGKTRDGNGARASTKTSAASTSNPSRNSRRCPRSPARAARRARIAIRVNPDVDARTHAKISTGKSENKFGIPISRAREVYARARALPGLEVDGVDMHIGSQITDLQPFDDAFALLADFVRTLRADGHAIDHVDLGGGLGIPYRFDNDPPPHPERYAEDRRAQHARPRLQALFRAGPADRRQRRRAGDHGALRQARRDKNFVIVDAAMNDLIRPTLYDAHHEIRPAAEPALDAPRLRADVVGPVCESGDYLALDRELAEPSAGDLLAVMSAGAYGAVQAGTYNSRLLVPEVLVKGDEFAVIRPRPSYAELIGLDKLPPWLQRR